MVVVRSSARAVVGLVAVGAALCLPGCGLLGDHPDTSPAVLHVTADREGREEHTWDLRLSIADVEAMRLDTRVIEDRYETFLLRTGFMREAGGEYTHCLIADAPIIAVTSGRVVETLPEGLCLTSGRIHELGPVSTE